MTNKEKVIRKAKAIGDQFGGFAIHQIFEIHRHSVELAKSGKGPFYCGTFKTGDDEVALVIHHYGNPVEKEPIANVVTKLTEYAETKKLKLSSKYSEDNTEFEIALIKSQLTSYKDILDWSRLIDVRPMIDYVDYGRFYNLPSFRPW